MQIFRWVGRLLASLAGCAVVAGSGFERVADSPVRLPAAPGGFGYRMVDALGMQFTGPVALATPPGETNRLFVVEQPGRIVVITNLAAPTRTVFLDLTARTVSGGEQGLLGLAFHPRYAENGRFFVFRTCLATTAGRTNVLHNRLSEFRVNSTNPSRALTTETVLFQQFDEAGNHNGGDLHFGPDGLLYVALGDEGGGDDQFNNGQRLDRDFFASLLRIDVDQRPGSLPPNPHPAVVGGYRIPADNPFVGVTNFLGRPVNPSAVRTEFFAVGLRNPWRMAFDRATGELWVGDVGQGQRESVFVTRAGANHGWPFREGPLAGPRAGSAPAGFLTNRAFQHVPPVHAYSHGSGPTQGRSLTGGIVYRGDRLAQLHGAYVFADYVSGNVWALRRRPGLAPEVVRLLGRASLSAFGADPRNGDVLACDLATGLVRRLEYTETFTGTPLPATLADTGAFADLGTLTPAPGLVPYEVNLPFWSDGADKRRWFSLPTTNAMLTFTAADAWGAPAGTVWVKHFDLETEVGVPASRRRLETRFLVRNATGVYGVTYRWDSPTNATLVPEAGAEEILTRTNAGQVFSQRWLYPGRAQCLACHTPAAGHTLSFNAGQLNRAAPGAPGGHQLAALAAAGYFTNPPARPAAHVAFAAPENEGVSLEWRVRSYLDVNCAPCHRPGGPGNGLFDARAHTPTRLTGLIDGALLNLFGDDTNRVVRPGLPEHSVLWRRLASRGAGQMPPLASEVADPAGVALLERWIRALAQPGPEELPSVTADATPGPFRLRVRQPANRRLVLEAASQLGTNAWLPVFVPGTEPVFPATAQELLVVPPPPEDTTFYRVRTVSP